MHRIPVKPLSANQMWRHNGRRFKSEAYRVFKDTVGTLLAVLKIKPPEPVKLGSHLMAHYQWGVSNPRSDVDNPCKPFMDVLFEHWGISSDHTVDFLILQKIPVVKGSEFIGFCVDDAGKIPQYLRDLADEIETMEGK